MKILINTIIDDANYGNRLQNYALQSILQKDIGAEVKTGIQAYVQELWVEYSQSPIKRVIKRIIPFSLFASKKKSFETNKSKGVDLLSQRRKKFDDFTARYLPTIPVIYARSKKSFEKQINIDQYDYVIAGSDQIWNPNFVHKYIGLLSFVPPSKRLSFAASISVPELTPSQADYYKTEWMKFKNLSAREEAGAKMIESLTGRKAEVTLDPTLLADPSIYAAIEKKPDYDLPEHYLLTYFLGAFPQTLEDYSKKSSIPFVRLNDESNPTLFTADPGEFVYLIHHCDGFYTDSFHGVAFSLIFHKNFYVFHRNQAGMPEMFSRIETILSKFSLMKRIKENSDTNLDLLPIEPERWAKNDLIRNEERNKSVLMLKKVMDVK